MEPAPNEMKIGTKSAKGSKSRANGAVPSREELLAAHERALRRVRGMGPRERFEALVRAGIYTSDGRLTPRYGG